MKNAQWLDELRDEYARSKPTAGQIGRLLEEFGEEQPDVMLAAVRAHMRSSRWWPQVAELVPHVKMAREAAQDAAAHEAQAERLYHSAATLHLRGIEAHQSGDQGALELIIQRLLEMGREYAAAALQARLEILREAREVAHV